MTDSATFGDGSVLVIQPDADDPLDMFEEWFVSEGLTIRSVKPFAGETVPERLEAAALVVLGGDMGVHDQQAHPWLRDIQDLLSAAVSSGTPTLGICLGSQLLAAAEGGTVDRGRQGMEVGAPTICLRPEGEDDALLGGLSWPAAFPSMHRDAIQTLPPGATWLAESKMYPHQAFRLGERAWGVQFHPEVSLERFITWSFHQEDDPATIARIERGVAEYASIPRQVARTAEPLARRFARIVQGSTGLDPMVRHDGVVRTAERKESA